MLYQDFAVTGVATETKLDAGLVSTEKEPKRVDAIIISVEKYAGNVIEGWIGTNRIITVQDYVFNTHAPGSSGINYLSTGKIVRLPINETIPPGQIFKIGIRCGGTDTDIFGAYEYTITT